LAVKENETLQVEPWLNEVVRAVKKMNYGSVELVVHDSTVIQIEIREKRRFDKKRMEVIRGK
jgi:hypothetical protein